MEQLTAHSLKGINNRSLMEDYRGALAVLVCAVKSGHGIVQAKEDVRVIEDEIVRRMNRK